MIPTLQLALLTEVGMVRWPTMTCGPVRWTDLASPNLTTINLCLQPRIPLRFTITAPVRLTDIVGFVSLFILLLMRVETCLHGKLVSVVRPVGSLLPLLCLHTIIVELTIIGPWPKETRSLLLLLSPCRRLLGTRTRIH